MKKLMFLSALVVAALTSCSQQQPAAEAEAAAADSTSTENQVIETIMNRTSVRSYKDQPVGRDTLDILAKAGIQAPSAMNKQDWEVRIVDDAETLSTMTEHMLSSEMGAKMKENMKAKNAFYGAPAVFFIAGQKGGEEGSFSQVDIALLAENIMLAAKSMGLGSVCVAGPVAMLKSPEAAEDLKKLGFSDDYELQIAVLVGYPQEVPAPKDRDASKVKYVE